MITTLEYNKFINSRNSIVYDVKRFLSNTDSYKSAYIDYFLHTLKVATDILYKTGYLTKFGYDCISVPESLHVTDTHIVVDFLTLNDVGFYKTFTLNDILTQLIYSFNLKKPFKK